MTTRTLAAVALALAAGLAARAAETVGVPGGSTQYPTTIDLGMKDGKPVKLKLTGVAMREKLFVNVYTVGSYLIDTAAVKSAEELAAAPHFKRLHLVMERTVDGKDMADSFRTAVRKNYPEPAFNDEVKMLADLMAGQKANKGDAIWLTSIPGHGLHIKVADREPVFIKNADFAKAVWDIYLGKNNLGEPIKKGLVSRLGS